MVAHCTTVQPLQPYTVTLGVSTTPLCPCVHQHYLSSLPSRSLEGGILRGRLEAGEVGSVSKVLAWQAEDRSSIPRARRKLLGVVVRKATSMLVKQRKEDPWGSLACQPTLLGELQANENPCLKTRWQ